MKVGIYLRCSNEAKERKTLETQEKECIEYCERRGWKDHKVYCDNGISGGDIEKRTAFKRLLQDIETGEQNAMIVWKQDRYARNTEDALKTIKWLNTKGCLYGCVHDPEPDINLPAGELQFTVQAAVDTYQLNNTAFVIAKNKRLRVQEGRLVQGKMPYGYRWVSPDTSKITGEKIGPYIVKQEADKIRRVWKLRSEGKEHAEISRTVRLNNSKVQIILKRDYYFTGQKPMRYDDVESHMTVPIIVKPSLADKVRAIEKFTDKLGTPKYEHLLRGGRLVCDLCGQNSQIRNVTINEKLYPYYYHLCKDGGVHLPAKEWDFIFWDRVVFATKHPETFVKSMRELQGPGYQNDIKSLGETKEDYLKEIEKRTRKKQTLLDQVEDEPKASKDLLGRIAEHNREIDALNYKVRSIGTKVDNLKKMDETISDDDLIQRIRRYKLNQDMTIEEKRKVVETLETIVYFLPLKAVDLDNFDQSDEQGKVVVASIKKLGGLPIRAEGLLDLDFNDQIDAR